NVALLRVAPAITRESSTVAASASTLPMPFCSVITTPFLPSRYGTSGATAAVALLSTSTSARSTVPTSAMRVVAGIPTMCSPAASSNLTPRVRISRTWSSLMSKSTTSAPVDCSRAPNTDPMAPAPITPTRIALSLVDEVDAVRGKDRCHEARLPEPTLHRLQHLRLAGAHVGEPRQHGADLGPRHDDDPIGIADHDVAGGHWHSTADHRQADCAWSVAGGRVRRNARCKAGEGERLDVGDVARQPIGDERHSAAVLRDAQQQIADDGAAGEAIGGGHEHIAGGAECDRGAQ